VGLKHDPLNPHLVCHDLAFPEDYVDPKTGLVWPKNDEQALRDYREGLFDAGERSEATALSLVRACARSFHFWADGFVWSSRDRLWTTDGKVQAVEAESKRSPWRCWPIDLALSDTIDEVRTQPGGGDVAVPKSREMRATWHCLLKILWLAQFSAGKMETLILGEKEEKVDGPNPSTLFPRLRYVIDHQPAWMNHILGHVRDQFRALVWERTGSSINGAATTGNAAVGERKHILMVDEAARNDHLQEIIRATRDAADCRIFVSTPLGAGAFKDMVFAKSTRVFLMGYWDHPEKGQGRQLKTADDDRFGVKAGSQIWWTPYLEFEATKRDSVDVGQNLMVSFDAGGKGVFDTATLVRLMDQAERFPALHEGSVLNAKPDGVERDLSIRQKKVQDLRFTPTPGGRLKLWCDVMPDRLGVVRPRQDRTYVLAMDVSSGVGSSNSVIAIGEAEDRVKVGMYVDSTTHPAELARVAAELALLFGGRHGRALIWWEGNYCGGTINDQLRAVGHGNVWFPPDKTDKPGWWSNPQSKADALAELRRAWAMGEFRENDRDTLREASYYVWKGGVPTPQQVVEDADARATHGDRVIATAGMWMAMREAPRFKPQEWIPPKGTIDHDIWKEQERKKAAKKQAW